MRAVKAALYNAGGVIGGKVCFKGNTFFAPLNYFNGAVKQFAAAVYGPGAVVVVLAGNKFVIFAKL